MHVGLLTKIDVTVSRLHTQQISAVQTWISHPCLFVLTISLGARIPSLSSTSPQTSHALMSVIMLSSHTQSYKAELQNAYTHLTNVELM